MHSNKSDTAYIMLDSETTGLDTRNAVAWQIGMVTFTADYCEVSSYVSSAGVSLAEWEPSTLNFAHKTYLDVTVEKATTENYESYLSMMGSAVDYIVWQVKQFGFKNVYLICNHTEFDWPIFLNSLAKAGIAIPLTGLVAYNNKLDMQSLCIGKVGAKHKAVAAELSKVSAPVQHLALADCYYQIERLKYFGVELP